MSYYLKSVKNYRKQAVALLLVLALCTGCGMNTGENNVSSKNTASSSGENVSNAPEQDKTPEYSFDPEDFPIDEGNPAEPTATPKPVVQKSRLKAGETIYSDNIRSITALGLKEYKDIRSKGYNDIPGKGNHYLVLFLKVQNSDEKEVYFHPDYLSAKVDGKKVKSTFLYRDPEGYKTIFRTIKAKDYNEGFIVWEVPENWQKMVMTFKGFEPLGGKRLKLTMTPKDKKNPPEPDKSEE